MRGINAFTATALMGIAAIGISNDRAVNVVLGLRQADFYKSMTTHADHHIWQDVYHATLKPGLIAYIKVTLRENGTVVIQFRNEMKHLCLTCGKGDMVRGKKDSVIDYRGCHETVYAVDGWHCPDCGEIEFADNEGARYAEAIEKLRQKVDADEAAELARIRKKLKLSQRRAAAIAGGGVNAFSRYENGKARPVAAVVNLFRLLDRHPELIDEISA